MATPLGRKEDARTPENEDEKTGGTNRPRRCGASSRERRPGQPASARPASATLRRGRRSGGATDDRAHAGGGSAGTRLPRRSFAKAGPACRASTGAAQRHPCSEPRPAARSTSKASGASLARAAIPQRRESRGNVPSGASAPRGIPCPTWQGPATVGNTFERRPGRTTIFLNKWSG